MTYLEKVLNDHYLTENKTLHEIIQEIIDDNEDSTDIVTELIDVLYHLNDKIS